MAWVRLSPGVYRNDQTGEVRKGQAKRPTDEGAAAPAPGTPAAATVPTNPQYSNVPLTSASDVFNATSNVGKNSSVAGNMLTNPNQVNPFGSQSISYDPVTGAPTVTGTLSKGNQGVLNSVQGNANLSGDALNKIFSTGALGSLTGNTKNGKVAPMSNYEQAVYNKLTFGQADQQKREQAALDQELAQKGITQGSALWNDQQKQLKTRYDQIYSNAKNDAVTSGVNQLQGFIPSLSSVNQSGFMNPNFTGFQSVAYQQPDVGGVFNTLTQKDLTQQQINKTKSSGGGGKSSGSSGPIFNG